MLETEQHLVREEMQEDHRAIDRPSCPLVWQRRLFHRRFAEQDPPTTTPKRDRRK